MATFSTNQVRHLYVVNNIGTVTKASAIGSIQPVVHDKHLYFKYMGAGGQVRSDLIPLANISSIKVTDADTAARSLVRTKLTLDKTVNTGLPIAGQEYILRILFKSYIGISDEDQHINYGLVQAYTGQSASDFYKTMVLSLVKNFSRGDAGLLKFNLETGGTDAAVEKVAVPVTSDTKASTLTEVYTGIIIEEDIQEWRLGTMRETFVDYTIMPTVVTELDVDKIWGVVAKVTPKTKVYNGKGIADMEYFYIGERGDQYRNVGWPYVRPTEYLANPALKYNVIDIHYAFTDEGVGSQRSEKDITIVVPKVGETNAVSNVMVNDLVNAINSETSLEITPLPVL